MNAKFIKVSILVSTISSLLCSSVVMAETQRCEVRPGCSVEAPNAGYCDHLRHDKEFVGGSCENGLLQGVVKVHTFTGKKLSYLDFRKYQDGRAVEKWFVKHLAPEMGSDVSKYSVFVERKGNQHYCGDGNKFDPSAGFIKKPGFESINQEGLEGCNHARSELGAEAFVRQNVRVAKGQSVTAAPKEMPALAAEKRCEVRPGCSIVIPPANKCSTTQYVGGSCPNGLLEGVVKIGGADSFNIFYRQFHQGKRTGPSVLHDRNSANLSSGYETTVYKPGETKDAASVYAARCRGATATERANSHPECQAAALILGVAAFEKESALIKQSNAVAEAPTAPAQDSGSTRKAIGDLVGAVADYKQAKKGGNAPTSQPDESASIPTSSASSTAGGMSPQECDEKIKNLQMESQNWPGNVTEQGAKLGNIQKRMFEGECAGHPQAAAYVASADQMIAQKQSLYVHNPANDATKCVEVRPGIVGKLSNSNLKIVNKCGYNVDVKWCVTPCKRGYDSMDMIKAGTEASIAEADPGDGAYYAACRAGEGLGFGWAPGLNEKRQHICK
jgi:hypothetical protein